MKRFSEQFHKKASSIRLKAAERRELKDRLVSYMEYHPLPAELRTPKQSKVAAADPALRSEPFRVVRIDFTLIRHALGALMLLVVVGVPFIAERSVPGDILYPVKVQFNEEVRSTLAMSPYAQVEWETERLERRLAEARLLAREGKLTEAVEAEVAEAIKTHSDNAKANIAKLREEDEDEAAIAEIAFASALAVQTEVLEGQAAKETTDSDREEGRSVATLASIVAEESRVAEATQASGKPSYEKLLARVELETTTAEELFASVREVASAEDIQNIERRLADVNRKLQSAISIHEGTTMTAEPDSTTASPADTSTEPDPTSEVVESAATGTEAATTASSEQVEAVPVATEPEVVEESVAVGTPADPEAAVELLRSALTDVRKLISFMTDIDVKENVSIDELLPIVLTADEEIALIKNTLEEVALAQTELANRAVPAESAEKFAIGEEKLTSLIARSRDALASEQLRAAKETADEALLVVTDLFAMTSATPQLEDDTSSEPPAETESTTDTDEAEGEIADESTIEQSEVDGDASSDPTEIEAPATAATPTAAETIE